MDSHSISLDLHPGLEMEYVEKRKRWYFIWAGICPVIQCVWVELNLLFLVCLFVLILGAKQTSTLKQEDASKRYENY